MRLHFKENPKEWRKAVLLGLIGPTVIIGILRWRGVVSTTFLAAALTLFVLVALCACVRPRWFRGYYRVTTWLGFYLIQFLGKAALTAFFFLILTPFGWIMRMMGKDLLQLKPPRDKESFWQKTGQDGSLDSMF